MFHFNNPLNVRKPLVQWSKVASEEIVIIISLSKKFPGYVIFTEK